jgi:hypothetical protein
MLVQLKRQERIRDFRCPLTWDGNLDSMRNNL